MIMFSDQMGCCEDLIAEEQIAHHQCQQVMFEVRCEMHVMRLQWKGLQVVAVIAR